MFKEHVETLGGIFRLIIVRVAPFRRPLGIFYQQLSLTLRHRVGEAKTWCGFSSICPKLISRKYVVCITSRWALMAARGWARLILDRRRDLISDRPNCATAAGAPLDGAQERYHFDNPTAHTSGAYQHSEAA